jgi:hypothetical protein
MQALFIPFGSRRAHLGENEWPHCGPSGYQLVTQGRSHQQETEMPDSGVYQAGLLRENTAERRTLPWSLKSAFVVCFAYANLCFLSALTFALRAGFRPGRIIFGLPATRFSEKGLKRG